MVWRSLIERAKLLDEHAASLAGSHADFENEDFGGELMLRIHVAQQVPELGHAVRDGVFVIAVRLAARQRMLVAFAGGLLPFAEVAPVKAVELPRDAVAKRFEIFEWKRGFGVAHRPQHFIAQRIRRDLTGVDAKIHDAGTARCGDYITKILLVLDPIELNVEAAELRVIDVALFEQFIESIDHTLGGGCRCLAVEMVQLQDHRWR